MLLVAMLVKRQQHVGIIARAQHFAAADAHLENGRAAGNRGGNGHERHDLLLAAASQPGQEAADGLDAILRIAGDADDRFANAGRLFSRHPPTAHLSLYHSWNFELKINNRKGILAAEMNFQPDTVALIQYATSAHCVKF